MRRSRRWSAACVGFSLWGFLCAVGATLRAPPARACDEPCCAPPAPSDTPTVVPEPCCGHVAPARTVPSPTLVAPEPDAGRAVPVALAPLVVPAPTSRPVVAPSEPRPPPDPLFLRVCSLLV